MAQAIINLRKQVPMQLVERMLMLQNIREIGVQNLLKLQDRKFRVFLLEVEGETEEDQYEIDWEFCIFAATSFQFNALMECFVPKQKQEDEPQRESNIIMPDNNIEDDRPPLILV